MLMSMLHVAIGVNLIALTMGVFLMKCGKKCCCCKSQGEAQSCDTQKCQKSRCGCIMGLIISIIAGISLLCTLNSGFKYWKAGLMDMPPAAMIMMDETIHMDNNKAQ